MPNETSSPNFKPYFDRNTIGFSHQFINELERNQNFPKYSIQYSKKPPYNYIIEVALAGYARDNISVTYDSFSLHIGSRSQSDLASTEDYNDFVAGKNYQYKGIAQRDFQLRFLLGPNCTDVSAYFKLGILTVELEFANTSELSQEVEIGDCPAASKYKASYPINTDMGQLARDAKLIRESFEK